jgi:putative serine protease PepD
MTARPQTEEPPPPSRSDRSPRWLVFVVGLLAAGLLAVLVWVAVGGSSGTAAGACDVASVATHVQPSVVTISSNGATGAGTGSGEVIRPEGYILTNNHVVSNAADGGRIAVQFADGTQADATLTGRDPQTDLAVLKVTPPYDLKVIAIGTSEPVHVGQPVVALGAPLGLSGTVTFGIVSALDRTIHVPGDNGGLALLVSAIQTDASINPGNSGGALVNCHDQLVGVPTAGANTPDGGGGSIGLNFAIPVDSAMEIADELITSGSVTHAYFGLVTVPIPPGAAAQAGKPEGLFVRGVAAGGPAATAGIETGDVITKIDGQPATSNIQIESLTLTRKAGDVVPVTVYRDGTSSDRPITLAPSP